MLTAASSYLVGLGEIHLVTAEHTTDGERRLEAFLLLPQGSVAFHGVCFRFLPRDTRVIDIVDLSSAARPWALRLVSAEVEAWASANPGSTFVFATPQFETVEPQTLLTSLWLRGVTDLKEIERRTSDAELEASVRDIMRLMPFRSEPL